MKKVKQLKGWGIYQNNDREIKEYGFGITVIHPENMDCGFICSPADTDMEMDSIEDAESWIKNYNK